MSVHHHNTHIRVDLPGDYWLELSADQAWVLFLNLWLRTNVSLKMAGYDRIEVAQLTTSVVIIRYMVAGESITNVHLEEPDVDRLLVDFKRLFRMLVVDTSRV